MRQFPLQQRLSRSEAPGKPFLHSAPSWAAVQVEPPHETAGGAGGVPNCSSKGGMPAQQLGPFVCH